MAWNLFMTSFKVQFDVLTFTGRSPADWGTESKWQLTRRACLAPVPDSSLAITF